MFKVREGGILTGEFVLLTAVASTANGASAESTIILGIVPYKSWRLVASGFFAATNGASTVAEKVNIGISASDIGATDDDYFGSFTQDATINKQMVAGDMFIYPTTGHPKLKTPDASDSAGSHSWAAGNPDGVNVWQSKQAAITITKKQVASSTAVVQGWALIEVGVG